MANPNPIKTKVKDINDKSTVQGNNALPDPVDVSAVPSIKSFIFSPVFSCIDLYAPKAQFK